MITAMQTSASDPLDGYVWDHNGGPMIPAVVRRDLTERGFRFGAPKPETGYCVDVLMRLGMVGVYRPAGGVCAPDLNHAAVLEEM